MRYTVKRMDKPDWAAVGAVALRHQRWLAPCDIAAKAQLCHDGKTLYVRMEAEEKQIRAELAGTLDQVCNDSCLEFFFAPKADDHRYFNFEINPLGTMYIGFGGERRTRARQILKDPKAVFMPETAYTGRGWTLEYRVPLSFIRMYMPDAQYAGEAACNFYKCGDATEIPHYLAWADLTSEKPDYHRRQDFGTIVFE